MSESEISEARRRARSDAIAFRIWQYANPIGWDCNLSDVAEALGVTTNTARAIAQWRGWLGRFRKDAVVGGINATPSSHAWTHNRVASDVAAGRVTLDETAI
jgi:hypothetical protein